MIETAQHRATALKEIGTAVRHSGLYSFGNILAKALGFAMLPFYTHYLGPGDYGLLEIIDLSISLLGMVLHMGIAPALLRSYAAAQSQADKDKAVTTVFLFAGATGLLMLVIACIRPARIHHFVWPRCPGEIPVPVVFILCDELHGGSFSNLPARARGLGQAGIAGYRFHFSGNDVEHLLHCRHENRTARYIAKSCDRQCRRDLSGRRGLASAEIPVQRACFAGDRALRASLDFRQSCGFLSLISPIVFS